MDPFITSADVQARLDFEMDEQELTVCEAAIEDASDLARDYGRDWSGPSTAPRIVLTLVRRAVTRHMKNPNGYTVSRAGDETLQWADDAGENMGDVYFTKDEQERLAKAAGHAKGGLVSVGTYAHNSRTAPRVGYVPTDMAPFPLYASSEDPW